MSLSAKQRKELGIFALLLWGVILAAARWWVEQPSPQAQHYNYGEAYLHFSTDREYVWQTGDCVNIQWDSANIKGIYRGQSDPTVGVLTTTWCAEDEVSNAYFTVQLPDESIHYLAPFAIYPIRTRLLITLLPLLVWAGWCFGLHQRLANLVTHLPTALQAPFSVAGDVRPLLVALFIGINAIVVWNTVTIRAWAGYDINGHYANVLALSAGHLPTVEESPEFFSPPLPYLFPALVARWSGLEGQPIQKIGQLQNIVLSLLSTFWVLRLGLRLQADKVTLRASSLFLLGLLTVYYKTFAFMRGEPFLVLLALFFCEYLLILTNRPPRRRDTLLLGILGGLLLLSRQWGSLILVAGAAWWLSLWLTQQSGLARKLFWTGLGAGFIALIAGGWFYLALWLQTGTPLAFNRQSDNQSKPLTFFTGLGGSNLLNFAYSPAYDGQALPIFYTEIWGDYFGYFYLERPPLATRQPQSAVTLMGRVNVTSFPLALTLLLGFVYGVWQTARGLWRRTNQHALTLFTACIGFSGLGFLWFLIRYPSGDADTAKATYMLQVFPLLCLLAGQVLSRLAENRPRIFRWLMVLFVLIGCHNLAMFFTRIH